jgi:drug/metabolite transporter (DMT)-like permease
MQPGKSISLDGGRSGTVRIRCFSRFVGLPFHLLLPLVSAVGYVIGALLLKRASDLGADVWRSTRIINYTQALMAIPLWLLGGTIQSPSLWWQPAIGGLLFFAGQVFTLLALTTGDVSVATPVLGVKILLVALLSVVLIGDPIGARLWTAAALSSVAIALLNISPGQSHRRVGTTILLAGLGAAAYASFDVLVQKFSPVWGTGRFLPLAMACGAAYSLALPRGRRADLPASPGSYTPWLVAGAVCFALQGLMFMSAVSIYRQVTSANVLYSSRGLWSVVAVWGIGHWFTNREQHLGARVLVWRFVGAILLLAAIVMVLLDR